MRWAGALLLLALSAAPLAGGEDAIARYQDALRLEEGEGRVGAALAVYEALAADDELPPGLRARALFRVAACRHKLGGRQPARRVYRELIDTYGAAVPGVAEAARQALETLESGGELELGRDLDRRGEHAQAEALYSRLLEGSPQDFRLHFLRAASRYARGATLAAQGAEGESRAAFREAFADFDHAVGLRPDAYLAWVWRARTRQVLGALDDAEEDLAAAVVLAPERPGAYLRRAELALERRRLPAARGHLARVLERDPGSARARLLLGRVHEAALEDDAARAEYERVLQRGEASPEEASAEALLALARLDLRQTEPALCLLDARRRAAGPEAGDAAALAQDAAALRARRLERAAERARRAREARPVGARLLEAGALLAGAPAEGAGDERVTALLAEAEQALDGLRAVVLAGVDPQDGLWDERCSTRTPRAALRRELLRLRVREARRSGKDPGDAIDALLAVDPGDPLGLSARAEGLTAAPAPERARAFRRTRQAARQRGGAWLREGRRRSQDYLRERSPAALLVAFRALARAWEEASAHAEALIAAAELAAAAELPDLARALADRARAADPWLPDVGLAAARLELSMGPPGPRVWSRAAEDYGHVLTLAAEAGLTRPAQRAEALLGRAQVHLARSAAGAAAARAAARADLEALAGQLPAEVAREEPAALRTWSAGLALLAQLLAEAGDAAELSATVAKRRAGLRAQIAALADAEQGQAEALRARQDYGGAVAALDRTLALDPTRVSALMLRGACVLKLGRFVPGMLDYARAVELDPGQAERTYDKLLQAARVVELKQALAELEREARARVDDSAVSTLRGLLRLAQSQLVQATRSELVAGHADLSSCLERNPEHHAAALYRALLELRLAATSPPAERHERHARAENALRAALARDFAPGTAQLGLAMLATARLPEAESPARSARTAALDHVRRALAAGLDPERIREERALAPLRGPELEALLAGAGER